MIGIEATLPLFKEKVHDVLQHLQSSSDRWDAIIRTDDGGCFKVHRYILSAASTYFRSLFMGPVSIFSRESTDTLCDVTISSVSSETMNCILNFAYSGDLQITESNVEELLRVTDRMLLSGAVRQCELFLSKRLTENNCIGMYLLSHQYFSLILREEARRYFLKHIHTVAKCEEYLKLLSFEELKNLMSHDELNIYKEEKVFGHITSWVMYNREEREPHFAQLAHTVRIGLCPMKVLKTMVYKYELIKSTESVISHIKDIIERLTTCAKTRYCDEYYFRPRVPPELIFAIAGWSRNQAIQHIEIYNVRTNKWNMSHYADTRARAYYGLVVLDCFLFCIGGYNGRYIERSVRRFDLRTFEWRQMASLSKPRNFVSAVAHKGSIYALGGFDGVLRLKSCEKYDPHLDRWKNHREMNNRRSDASAVVYKSHIFVAGGFNGEEWLQSVEMYSSKLDTWTEVSNMINPRGSHTLFLYKEFMYVVGGHNGRDRMNTLEKYNETTKEWTKVYETNESRSNLSVAVMGGRIYLIGGFNGIRTQSTVEVLKEDKGIWKHNYKMAKMNVPRSGLAVCVLKSSLFKASDYSRRPHHES